MADMFVLLCFFLEVIVIPLEEGAMTMARLSVKDITKNEQTG